jgi:deoxyribonuclease V
MKALDLHPWKVAPTEAVDIQRHLAARVIGRGAPTNVRRVAGVDISVGGRSSGGRGAVVILSYPELDVVEQAVVEVKVESPYVPGLLSFRETPVLLDAFEQIEEKPDLLLVDGQGFAHPRRFGLACHLGLIFDVPTIGCAKSRLCGQHGQPEPEAGSRVPLVDRDELIGTVLRTRDGVSPIYVSVGHRIGLDEATEWVLRCCRGYRLPEPTRMAHMAAGGQRLEMKPKVEATQQMSMFES